MARRIHSYDDPRRFVAGTIGMPGERTFYLQAVTDSQVTSVSLEKSQVSLLADRLDDLLEEVARRFAVSSEGSERYDDNRPLTMPVEDEFRVGAMSLGWDEGSDRIVLEAHAVADGATPPELTEDDPDAADTLRVRIPAAQGAAFVRRARALVSAGRPPCPFCLQPLDPQGHVCARANGYRRRA